MLLEVRIRTSSAALRRARSSINEYKTTYWLSKLVQCHDVNVFLWIMNKISIIVVVVCVCFCVQRLDVYVKCSEPNDDIEFQD